MSRWRRELNRGLSDADRGKTRAVSAAEMKRWQETGVPPPGHLPLGHVIRAARKAAGMTQPQLAAAIGTTQPYLSDLERGERTPSIQMLIDIADACDCDLVVEMRRRER